MQFKKGDTVVFTDERLAYIKKQIKVAQIMKNDRVEKNLKKSLDSYITLDDITHPLVNSKEFKNLYRIASEDEIKVLKLKNIFIK